MKKVKLLVVVMLIVFTAFSQKVALLDSTIVYDYSSGISEKALKEVYDAYTSENQVSHKMLYFWDNSMWSKYGETNITYNANGDTLMIESYKTIQDTAKNFPADYKKIFLYDKVGNLAQEIYYYNKYDRLGITPNWEESSKDVFYGMGEKVDSIETYVGLKYWQGSGKTYLTYNMLGDVEKETSRIWIPEVKVKKYNEAYYSQNVAGDANYLFSVYNVESTASMNDLEDIYVNKLTEVVNVFVVEDGTEKRYDLSDVGGKSLKAILEGDNGNGTVIKLSDLRHDYHEWFKTIEDDKNTLLNCNIKAGRPFDVLDVVDEYTGFSRNVGSVVLNVTAYRIKAAASLDQLTGYTAADDAVWANIYITDGDDERVERITGVAGKTLNAIFADNNIVISSLSQNHTEKYVDKTGDTKRRKVNVEIITPELENTKVDIYKKLYDTVNYHVYSLTAYNVHSDAQTSDLDVIVTGTDVTSLFVYKSDGSVQEITTNIQGKTLSAILVANSIQISDLATDHKDWMYDENGRRVRLAVNIKEGKDLGAINDVVVTEELYSSGSSDYVNTTYKINTTDWAVLENYTLGNDVEFLDVYIINALGNKERIDLHGVAGKTLAAAMKASGNNESINVDLTQLRDNYGEWFYDKDGKLIYNKFNVKAAVVVNNHPVKIKDNLLTTSGSFVFTNKAYLVESYATATDLASYTIDADVEYLNVYLNNIRHSLHGVAGKTLKAVLIDGDNNENITISLSDLNQKYVEWFVNKETGKADLVNLNLKSVYKINTGLDRKTNQVDYTYTNGKLTSVLTTWYDDNATAEFYNKTNYTLNTEGKIQTEEYLEGTDLSALDKESKNEYTYNTIGSINELTYYKFNGTDYDKKSVKAFYYIAFKAFAGKDQVIMDKDNNGVEDVILNGKSTYILSGNIQSFEWLAADTVLAAGDSVKVTLPVGVHTITLKVTDNNSNIDTDTCIVTIESDTEAPTAPENLTATDVTMTSISLVWDASTDNVGVVGYYIYKNEEIIDTVLMTSFSMIKVLTVSSTIVDLIPDTEYTFFVKAVDLAGNFSDTSNILVISTFADTEAPTAPANLTASDITATGVNLTWDVSTDNIGVAEYYVLQDGVIVDTVTETSLLMTELSPETEYVFTVKAADAAGNISEASNAVTVNTLTGINDIAQLKVDIYPNPVSDRLNIIVGSIDATVQITDINGQVVKILDKEKGTYSIDMTDFKAGIYFVKVVVGNKVSVNKIIKK